MTDLELIKHVRDDPENCAQSYNELLNRYKLKYLSMATKIVWNITGSAKWDLLEDHNYVLSTAINTYNQQKGTEFSTWFTSMAKWHCLTAIRSLNKDNHYFYNPLDKIDNSEVDFGTQNLNGIATSDISLGIDRADPSFSYKAIERDFLDILREYPDQRIFKIVQWRLDGFKMKEIAVKLDITKEYCSFLFKTSIRKIFGENLNFSQIGGIINKVKV
jgi:RNA polymerase sigma factor (sigma-70 family)